MHRRVVRLERERRRECSEEQNKDLVRRLVDEVINNRRHEVINDLFAPSLADGVRHGFSQFRSAFPDWREEIVELVAEGDRVAAHFRCLGTHKGEFMGAAPTGKPMDIDEVYFLRVADGKFVEAWGLEDTWGRLQQLGLAPVAQATE